MFLRAAKDVMLAVTEEMMLDLHEEIIKSMRATPAVLRAITAGLDDALARHRPGPGQWAVTEVVGHMADTDERAHTRLGHMLKDTDPYLPAFDQDALVDSAGYISGDLQVLVARYVKSRAAHLAQLRAINRDQWQRTGRHETAGTVTVELYEAHVASEDVDHLAQIAAILTGLHRCPQPGR